jgi:hypothetical protein
MAMQKVAWSFLRAVAFQHLWICHFFFGLAGSRNDISVLQRSVVFTRLAEGNARTMNYEINIHHYDKETIFSMVFILNGSHA